MRVKLGQLEFIDPSPEELDDLIRRYGSAAMAEGADASGSPPGEPARSGNRAGGGTTDRVILRQLVDAGTIGVATSNLGVTLGRRGKATRGAAREWALRVGLVNDSTMDPFEECRIGTQRALRIRSGLMDVARALLG